MLSKVENEKKSPPHRTRTNGLNSNYLVSLQELEKKPPVLPMKIKSRCGFCFDTEARTNLAFRNVLSGETFLCLFLT